MSILSALQTGIAIADSVTKPAQSSITVLSWIGQDGRGADVYAAPKTVHGAVDVTRKRVFVRGQELIIAASITIMEAVPDTTPNPPHTRTQPFDPRDVITLQDGTTGPTILAGGFMDPSTSRPLSNDIMLGAV